MEYILQITVEDRMVIHYDRHQTLIKLVFSYDTGAHTLLCHSQCLSTLIAR